MSLTFLSSRRYEERWVIRLRQLALLALIVFLVPTAHAPIAPSPTITVSNFMLPASVVEPGTDFWFNATQWNLKNVSAVIGPGVMGLSSPKIGDYNICGIVQSSPMDPNTGLVVACHVSWFLLSQSHQPPTPPPGNYTSYVYLNSTITFGPTITILAPGSGSIGGGRPFRV